MQTKTLLLSCALVALLVAYLPMGEAVTCDVAPTDAACVNCDLRANQQHADCVAQDEARHGRRRVRNADGTDPRVGRGTRGRANGWTGSY